MLTPPIAYGYVPSDTRAIFTEKPAFTGCR
jgi:hypothetical protein